MNTTIHIIEQLMKPVNVKYNAWIDSSKEVNDNDRKFKFGDRVRIS